MNNPIHYIMLNISGWNILFMNPIHLIYPTFPTSHRHISNFRSRPCQASAKPKRPPRQAEIVELLEMACWWNQLMGYKFYIWLSGYEYVIYVYIYGNIDSIDGIYIYMYVAIQMTIVLYIFKWPVGWWVTIASWYIPRYTCYIWYEYLGRWTYMEI